MKFRRFLETWIVLSAILAVALTALAYPMNLSDGLFVRLASWFAARGELWSLFFHRDLMPLFTFGYHPLVLKETLGALCAFLMFVGYWAWKLIYAPKRKEPLGLHFPLLLLMAFAGASLMWTPSFSISLKTLEAFVPAAFFFLMISDFDWREHGRRKLLTVLAIVGGILTIVGLMQITPGLSSIYYQFYLRFADPRNSVPGWIGHNTEMSSYVLSGMLASTALLLTTRRVFVRVLTGLHLIGGTVVIIAAQSRAIWPLSIFLLAWLALGGMREMGKRIRAWHVAAVLAVLLVLLAPFAGKVKERIKHYGPQAVMVETRTRILFASQGLIREKPWLGHGIGSFASVYPKAQGDFFARYPDSPFAPTDKRTPQAHNDYLQLLVELGIVGLALTLAGLLLYIRYGANGMKALSQPTDRILALAFGLIVVQHLLNAVVNFPLHVAPAAYLLALAMGVWVATGRESVPQPLEQEAAKTPSSPVLRVILLIVAMGPLAIAPMYWGLMSRELVATTHYMMGIYHLNQLSNPNAKYDALEEAQRQLLAARRLEPLDFESNYQLAALDFEFGKMLARQYRASAESNDPRAAFMRVNAGLRFQQGIEKLKPPYAEVQFHQTFLLMAQLYQELENLYPGQYSDKVRENLELSVRYSPVYYQALETLLKFYSTGKNSNPPRQMSIAKKMYEVDPTKFVSEFVEQAQREFIENDVQLAAQKYNFLNHIVKPDANLFYQEMVAWLYAGQMDLAIDALTRMERFLGKQQPYWHALMMLRLAQGQEEEGLRLALQHGAQTDPPDPIATALATIVLEERGETDKAGAMWKRAFGDFHSDYLYRTFRAQFCTVLQKYPRVLEKDLSELLKPVGAAGAVYYMKAVHEYHQGRFAEALGYAEEAAMKRGYERSQANQQLIAELRKRLLVATRPATQPSTRPVK